MKRLIALVLVLCMALCGCGSGSDTDETTVPTETTVPIETTSAPEETAVSPETTEPEEEILFINPLTGEAQEEEYTARPIAIMLNNHHVALPHCGVSAADIIYETCVEGGMTRYMALFTDPASAGPIGSVRSCRPPYVDLVQAYDAIYCSASGDSRVLASIESADIDYINALSTSGFYRDSWRKENVGYEHSLFIKGEDLLKAAENKGFRTTAAEDIAYGLNFDDSAEFTGETAEKIVISFTKGGKTTTCKYDAELGGYTLNQYSMDYVDGNTGDKVVFRNVLILAADYSTVNSGKHVQMDTIGEGTGYYARDGKIVEIFWSRESADAPFVYTYADGTEVDFGVGMTYIAIHASTAGATFE